jgi:dTDP-4-amino-4,6-dideoxygalactose transaminase
VILRVKLKRIEEFTAGRRRVAHLYRELLNGSVLTPPFEDGMGTHVYHQYTTVTDRRDAVMDALTKAQIASAIYYPIPLHRQEVFAAEFGGVTLPVSEEVASRCLSLPVFPEMTEQQVRQVAEVVKSVG